MNDDKPWWWPTVIDDAYLERLRDDYPEKPSTSDYELLEYFELACAFLKLVDETGKKSEDFF